MLFVHEKQIPAVFSCFDSGQFFSPYILLFAKEHSGFSILKRLIIASGLCIRKPKTKIPTGIFVLMGGGIRGSCLQVKFSSENFLAGLPSLSLAPFSARDMAAVFTSLAQANKFTCLILGD